MFTGMDISSTNVGWRPFPLNEFNTYLSDMESSTRSCSHFKLLEQKVKERLWTLVPLSATASTTPTSLKKFAHPSEWTVEQVVEWVRSRGFDEDVCTKFQGPFVLPLSYSSISLHVL